MRQSLRLPAFGRLLAAYAFNELAWSVGTLALAVLVYRRTGSVIGSMGFFLCAQVFPALLSPPLVARLDRRAPKLVLPALYALEGLLFGLLAWMTSRFSLVPMLALSLADGVVAIVARSIASAARSQILKPVNLLHEGNALTNGVFSVCFMAGPLIGGIVVAAGGTVTALLASCVFFVVMALVLATGDLPRALGDMGPAKGRLRAALQHARDDRTLARLLILQAIGLVFFTISIPVEVVYAQHSLHAGPGGYGAMLSAWGAGAVAGSAVYARWHRRPAGALIGVSAAGLGLGFALIAVAPSIGLAVFGAAVAGAGNSVEWVAARTAIQERTPQRLMAMIVSLNESLSQLAPGLGILLGGAITALTAPRVAFWVAAAGSIAFGIAAVIAMRPSSMTPGNGDGDGESTGTAPVPESRGQSSVPRESVPSAR